MGKPVDYGAKQFNEEIADPSNETHTHNYVDGVQEFGNSGPSGGANPIVNTTKQVTPVKPGVSVYRKVVGQKISADDAYNYAAYLKNSLSHGHSYDDEAQDVCECNCACGGGGTRGTW